MGNEDVRKAVREGYAKVVKQDNSCCTPVKSCCGSTELIQDISKKIGYTDVELKAAPEGANLGLGCGNPVALASLKQGEIVLDLGSGAGFDCFLAAGRVGEGGKVIGVDMTPEMIEKARENARKSNYANVEFRLGEIEHLPAADNSVDAVISNCVINLSPDKKGVFTEAFRVLKPGGRLMISDIVLLKELPAFIKNSLEAYIGCVAGAMLKDDYLKAVREAGFQDVKIIDETAFPAELIISDPTAKEIIKKLEMEPERAGEVAGSVVSIKVSGIKPISITS
jgi:arsenite methyltransferase